MNDPQLQLDHQKLQEVIDAFAGGAGAQTQLMAFIELWLKATFYARSIRQIAAANANSAPNAGAGYGAFG